MNSITKNAISETLSQTTNSKIDYEFNTESYLSGWEDENRDRMRDFINLMRWGYDHQLDFSPEPIKDELEYLKKVYKYYIWDTIYNHNLIALLISDREGRLNTPISEMSVEELVEGLISKTTFIYNSRVLGKELENWGDKVDLDARF